MKCKAKCWVNYGGEWHKAGDVFPIAEADAEMMKANGEIIEEPDLEKLPEIIEPEKPKRGRKTKNEE